MKFIVRSLAGEIKCELSLDNQSTIYDVITNIKGNYKCNSKHKYSYNNRNFE